MPRVGKELGFPFKSGGKEMNNGEDFVPGHAIG